MTMLSCWRFHSTTCRSRALVGHSGPPSSEVARSLSGPGVSWGGVSGLHGGYISPGRRAHPTFFVRYVTCDFFGFLQKPRPTSFARNSDETTEKPNPCATQSCSVDWNCTGTGLVPTVAWSSENRGIHPMHIVRNSTTATGTKGHCCLLQWSPVGFTACAPNRTFASLVRYLRLACYLRAAVW